MTHINTPSNISRMLSGFIAQVYPLPQEIIERLAEKAHWQKVSRMETLCQEGKVFDKVVWVAEGIFHVSRVMMGQEQTLVFGVKGDAFLSPDTYLNGAPSQLSFNPIIDSEVIYVTIDDFKELVASTELVMWFNKVLLRQIHALENRYIWLGQQDAYSRYLRMIKQRPEVAANIPLKYIASYLGVTQSHLSRIRARIAGKQP